MCDENLGDLATAQWSEIVENKNQIYHIKQ